MTVFDPAPLVAAVEASEAPYVLIGGVAVGLHGFVRATTDVDVLIPESEEARQKLADGLGDVLEDDSQRERLDRWVTEGGNLIKLMTRHGQLDILEEGYGPLAWDPVAADAERRPTADGSISVCGLRTLVTLKRISGRPVDSTDLIELERANGELPKTEEEES